MGKNDITWHQLKHEMNDHWVDKKIICDPPDIFFLTFASYLNGGTTHVAWNRSRGHRVWGPTADELETFRDLLTGDQVLEIEAMRDRMILKKL